VDDLKALIKVKTTAEERLSDILDSGGEAPELETALVTVAALIERVEDWSKNPLKAQHWLELRLRQIRVPLMGEDLVEAWIERIEDGGPAYKWAHMSKNERFDFMREFINGADFQHIFDDLSDQFEQYVKEDMTSEG